MATKVSTIEYIEDQLALIPGIRSRKMFGEYALYCGDKVVALVCDDELFVKITEAGKAFVGERYAEGIAYPGARPSMHIDEDLIEDRERLAELIRITAESLPVPKPKRIRKNDMPHIHTKPGEIDRTASVFIVHVPSRRVLLRLHEKHGIWLPPGGHIENTQTAPEAAVAEAWEEVGLRIRLWDGNQRFMYQHEGYADILPPIGMNIHFISPEHRHEDHVYFATAETTEIIEPEGREKSGGCRWLTREEIECHEDLEERVRQYALEALRILAPL